MTRTIDEIIAGLREKPIERSFVIERDAAVDEESRTVNLAFATDTPIEHWFGTLALSMTSKAMRSERLKGGMALLMDHNSRDQVGVVENFSLDKGVARADVRFDTDQRSTDIFNSVKNGVRRNVSVGFMVHEMHLESEKKGEKPVYRSDDWEPYEISIVAIPADTKAGVGREFEPPKNPTIPEPHSPESRAFSTETEKTMTEAERLAAEAEAQRTAAPAVVETRSPAMIAAEEVQAWGDNFGQRALADQYVIECRAANPPVVPTEAGFFARVSAAQPPATSVPPQNPQDIARNAGIQLATSVYRGGALKSFKGEKAQERAYRAGMFLAAALGDDEKARTFCRENGIAINRAHGGGTNALGGILVPEEFENVMIDLRLQYGVFRPNANVVTMTSDTKSRPRRTGGLTAYFRRSGTAATESTKGWDSVELVAKLCSVLTKYENELSDDAAINIGDDLVSEIAYAFAAKEDDCGFNGDGSSTYDGIVGVRNKLLNLHATRANIAGLQVASGNLWSEIVIGDLLGVVGKLPQFARRAGNIKWYCSSEFWANVLQRLALAAGGATHAEYEGELKESFLGKPVEICESMPHVEANDVVPLLYGNLAQAAMFGDRKGTSIEMTNSDGSDFGSGIMAIRGDTRFDINVHDVGNAHATAASRTPGPIVGLLTAAS